MITEKQVVIYVRAAQYFDGAPPDQTELMTEGVMRISDSGEIVFEYQETELTGMEGTTTSFMVQGDTVSLTRTGQIQSHMIFQRGKQHSSLYEMPWGSMLIDIATTKLEYRLNEHGGIMEINFNISVDYQVTGMNKFKIRIRESMR